MSLRPIRDLKASRMSQEPHSIPLKMPNISKPFATSQPNADAYKRDNSKSSLKSLQSKGFVDSAPDPSGFSKENGTKDGRSLATSGLQEEDRVSARQKQMLVLEMQKKIEEQRRELEERNLTVSALQRNFESLSALCRNERNENQTLKRAAESLKAQNVSLEEQIDSLEKKLKDLQSNNEQASKEKKKNSKLSEEITYMKMQNQTLQKQLQKKLKDYQDLDGAFKKFKDQTEKIKREVTDLIQGKKEIENKLKQAQNEILRYKQEYKELENRMNGIKLDRAEGQRKLEEIERDLKEAYARVRAKIDQNNKLVQEMSGVKHELKTLQEELNSQKGAQNSQSLLLNSKIMDEQLLKNKLLEEKRKVELNEKNIRFLETQVKQMKDSFEKEKTELLGKLLETERERDQQKSEKDHFNRLYQDITEKREVEGREKDQTITQLTDKVEKLEQSHKNTIKSLNFEIHDLKEEVTRLKSRGASDVDNLLKKLNQKVKETELLSKTLEEKEKASMMIQSKLKLVEGKLQKIEKERDLKQEECEGLKEDLHEAQLRIQTLMKKVKHLEADVAEGQERFKSSTQNSMDLYRRISELEEKLSTLRAEHQQLQTERDILQNQRDELEKEVQARSKSEQELKLGMDTLGSNMSENILKLKKQLDSEIQNVSNLSSRKNQAEEHKRKLQKHLEKLEQQLKEKDEALDDLHSSLEKAQIEVISKKREIEILSKENIGLKSQKENAERQCTRLVEELDNLKNKYDLEEYEEKMKIQRLKEEKFSKLIEKLDSINESLENNVTCYHCMELFSEPMTCFPCGHNFCKGCIKSQTCKECKSKVVKIIPNKTLTQLVNKLTYKRHVMEAFKNEEVWKYVLKNLNK